MPLPDSAVPTVDQLTPLAAPLAAAAAAAQQTRTLALPRELDRQHARVRAEARRKGAVGEGGGIADSCFSPLRLQTNQWNPSSSVLVCRRPAPGARLAARSMSRSCITPALPGA